MDKKFLRILILVICLCIAALTIGFIVLQCLHIKNLVTKENFYLSQCTYVALGDSITEGNDGFAAPGVKVPNPYPVLVQKKLNLMQSVNFGIGGSTVASGTNSYHPMCERHLKMPDANIVSVLGGVNDYAKNIPLGTINDTDTTTFYGALNTIAKDLKNKYPDSLVFFMTPYKFAGVNGCNENGNTLEQFADAVKQVCDAYSLPCLDLYSTGRFEDEMYSDKSDGLHPSQKFYADYTAPQIARFIKENISFE